MAYGFKCPQCGGFKWGTLDCGKPKQEWIGTCNGDRDYPGCGFRWHRATEDEKIIGIPFGRWVGVRHFLEAETEMY